MLGLIAPQYGRDTPELHQQRQARTCSQKVTHLTRAEAKARVVKLSRQKRVKLKPYKCPTCGFFHLTKAMNMNEPGYESLAQVLQEAYDQAARGKGAERHANARPFDQQPMQQIARRRGLGFLLGQVDKKTEEAQGMLERGDRAAWRREILGAINYLAGALVFTADESEQTEPTKSDSPVWRSHLEMPLPGREVVIRNPAGEDWRGVWRHGCDVSPGTRWRYVD